jgi:uncharacterized membrane protein
LAWLSIGIGVAEVIAPRKVAELAGIPRRDTRPGLLRAFGIREIASGVGILTRPQPAGWLWGRVAGDVLDLSYVTSALGSRRANRKRVVTATAAVLGVTALDVMCGQQLTRQTGDGRYRSANGATHAIKSIMVNCSPEEAYSFWHNVENFPKFMKHVVSVRITGENRTHWRVRGPGGKTVNWDAEIFKDEPNSLIAWRTVDPCDVRHSGAVRFQPAPGDRGTMIKVQFKYEPPGGKVAETLAKIFHQDPGSQIEDDLRAFKQIMETGEVVKSDASIYPGMHPAQPPAEQPSFAA